MSEGQVLFRGGLLLALAFFGAAVGGRLVQAWLLPDWFRSGWGLFGMVAVVAFAGAGLSCAAWKVTGLAEAARRLDEDELR